VSRKKKVHFARDGVPGHPIPCAIAKTSEKWGFDTWDTRDPRKVTCYLCGPVARRYLANKKYMRKINAEIAAGAVDI
jgi:hypothetical protein